MLEHKIADPCPNETDPDTEQRVLAISEIAFDAVIELDEHGIITAWNAGAEGLFGWCHQTMIGKHVDIIVSPRHRQAVLTRLTEALALRDKLPAREPVAIRACHREGRRFSIELFLHPRRLGEDSRIAVFVRDLNEREQLQRLLSERANQRAILNLLEEGYAELDLAGNYQW